MLESVLVAGEEKAVEQVLAAYPHIASAEDLVVELIYNEYLIRDEQGDAPQVEEYLDRFSAYSSRIQRLFSIHTTLSDEQTLDEFASEALTPPRRLGSGDTVGPFQLISSLGTGGRGFVFKARQLELDRVVALKILKGNATNDLEIKRFLGEAKAAANLQHPNIVQVYESDIYENLPYIALEYVSGGTLDEKCTGSPTVGKEAAKLIAVVADAMQYAHDRGIIHRDLKPSNILLTEDGTPKVTDFGLAKRLQFSRPEAPQSVTESGAVLGTPSYMSPEQAEGHNNRIGPGTDVYGLGVVLYQLITGQVPFVGESTLDVLQSIRALEPVAPSLLNPKVPRDLETICLKCLEKDPASRYGSAAGLSADLNRFLSGHPILARPTSLLQRSVKVARRHPTTTALSAALITAVFAVIGVISWQWKQAALGEKTQTELRDAAEAALYSQQLALAHKEIRSSESQRALEILQDTEPSRRHWEWEYLRQACDAYTTLATLGPDTRRCVVSADGGSLAIVKGRWGTDAPGMLAVIDMESRKLRFKHEYSFGPTMDAAFSPDGAQIATVSNRFKSGGGEISFHDTRTGEKLSEVPFPSSGLFGIAYHPFLPRIALAKADHSVEIWDAEKKKLIHQLNGHRDKCFRVSFSPAGEQLASCSRDGTARLWNSETGEQEAVLHAGKDLMSIEYTPDGRFVVANGHDQAIQFWDRLENTLQHSKVHLAGDLPLTFDCSISPEGRYLTALGDAGKRLFSYDLWIKRLNVRASETSKRPYWLEHHPRLDRLYLVDADGNVMESKTRRSSPFKRFVTASATDFDFHQGSNSMAIASGASRALPTQRDFRCQIVSLSNSDEQYRFFEGAPTWSSAIGISSDGNFLASGCEDGTVLQWNVTSGELVAKSQFHKEKIVGLMYLPNDGGLVTIDSGGWLATWQQPSNQPVSKPKVSNSKIQLAELEPNARRLVIHTNEGKILQIDIGSAKRAGEATAPLTPVASDIRRMPRADDKIRSLAISPDGQHVAVASHESLELWVTATSETRPVWSVAMPLTSATDIAFHPDGNRLAIVDGWLGRVVLFDIANGQKVLELNTRSGTDRANVAFSSDGEKLFATLAGELYIWSNSALDASDSDSTPADRRNAEYRNNFQWHVNQSSEQIYGGLPLGAEFHAQRALHLLENYFEKIEGMSILEVLAMNAKCHLAKSLVDSGRVELGHEMFKKILAECPEQFKSIHTLSLLLATYPGRSVVSNEQLIELANRAIELKPDDSNAWAVAGIAYYQSGNATEARKHLEHAKNIMTSWDGLVLFPLAELEADTGNHEVASRHFKRASKWMESEAPKQQIIRAVHRRAAAKMAGKTANLPKSP